MIDSLITALSFPFIQRALMAGCIIGITTAFLGVFVTLRNMSFYSDAISHSALAGIAIGLLFSFDPFIGAVLVCILLGLGTAYMKSKTQVSIDTLIGVLFAAGISLGIALLSQLQGFQGDVFSFLFGDILSTTWADIEIALALSILLILFLLLSSKRLLLTTFSPDFSYIRGLSYKKMDYAFFIATALTIAISIKVIGIVLITGMLIIPAAVAKNIAYSFKQVVYLSIVTSLVATVSGILLSFYINIPSGPAIILIGTGMFIAASLIRRH